MHCHECTFVYSWIKMGKSTYQSNRHQFCRTFGHIKMTICGDGPAHNVLFLLDFPTYLSPFTLIMKKLCLKLKLLHFLFSVNRQSIDAINPEQFDFTITNHWST